MLILCGIYFGIIITTNHNSKPHKILSLLQFYMHENSTTSKMLDNTNNKLLLRTDQNLFQHFFYLFTRYIASICINFIPQDIISSSHFSARGLQDSVYGSLLLRTSYQFHPPLGWFQQSPSFAIFPSLKPSDRPCHTIQGGHLYV